jgi:flagellar hook protein FlgE
MMKALFAAIAGLQNHITYMDVVGNNIANVNTQGFKSSRVTFQDMLTQTLQGASAPTEDRGGTNPQQVGLGMKLGAIDVMHSQGSLQATGRLTDFAIQGSGFFILNDGSRTLYTRDGAFDIAVTGELVNSSNGYKVQGWNADTNGAVDSTQPVGSITIPFGQSIGAQVTTAVTLVGNLDSRSTAGPPADSFSTTVEVYDSLGASHAVEVRFTRNAAANTWDVLAVGADLTADVTPAPAQVVFNASGQLQTPAPGTPLAFNLTLTAAAANGADTAIAMNANIDGLTQFASSGQVGATFNNGFSAGSLISFSVGPGGDITGIFSNGTTRAIGQLAMATFTNPAGLQRAGANNFEASSNSGTARVGLPGDGGRGAVGTGVLEGSNTDLAREFTNVVIAQRGFQASSRIISTSDEMLELLVNLKR